MAVIDELDVGAAHVVLALQRGTEAIAELEEQRQRENLGRCGSAIEVLAA